MAVHFDTQLNHARTGTARDDHVIERQTMKNLLTIAHHYTLEQRTPLGGELAIQDIAQHRQHVFRCNIGHETQTTLIHAN